MNNNLVQSFTNEIFGNVTVLDINNELWFVGHEIAGILGYARPADAIYDHVFPDDKMVINNQFFNIGETPILKIPNKGLTIINESGLYSLIFSSKLPAAIEFKHWVTSQVLPTMRKVGFTRSMQLLDEAREQAELRAQFSEQSALEAGIREAQLSNELYQIKDKIYKSNLSDEFKRYLNRYDIEYGEE